VLDEHGFDEMRKRINISAKGRIAGGTGSIANSHDPIGGPPPDFVTAPLASPARLGHNRVWEPQRCIST